MAVFTCRASGLWDLWDLLYIYQKANRCHEFPEAITPHAVWTLQ